VTQSAVQLQLHGGLSTLLDYIIVVSLPAVRLYGLQARPFPERYMLRISAPLDEPSLEPWRPILSSGLTVGDLSRGVRLSGLGGYAIASKGLRRGPVAGYGMRGHDESLRWRDRPQHIVDPAGFAG
jgi:hypothetical protein